ncbi:MAG: PASTA domain-containing protein [Bacteroidales bacterium]|nr:PASTA domain-containing protein [Bacteroidales bacterium]
MKPGLKHLLSQFALIAGIVLVVLLLVFQGLKYFTRHGQTLLVPDFSGMTITQAQEIAKRHHLRLEVSDSIFLPQRARGTIFKQIPQSGEKVKKNRRILLTINSVLPRKIPAPSLVGHSLRQAKAELAAQNFQLGRLSYVDDFATNTVLEQRHAGATLPPGMPIDAHSVIDLILGVNQEFNYTYVPRIIGLSYELAKDRITDHSLNVGSVFFDATVRNASDSLAAVVVRQDPEASDAAVQSMGSRVAIFLSLPQSPNQ